MRPISYTTIQRPEFIADVGYVANQPAQLPTEGGNLPRDRYLFGLLVTVRGRATMPASGGPTALLADGPYQLIDRLIVEGYHNPRAQNERFVDLRGADLVRLTRLYAGVTFEELPASWSFSGSATNDFMWSFLVPFVPLGVSPFEQLNYLLDAPNYNPLKLTIQWADAASMFNSYTNAPTLSAFGSASGSPVASVVGLFALAGAHRFAGRSMGKVWRFFQDVSGSPMTTSATNVRLQDLPKGHYLRSIILKTGTVATTVSAGNTAFATLADLLTNIRIFRGLNTPVQYVQRPQQLRDLFRLNHFITPPTGLAPIDFAGDGVLSEAFSARNLVAGPSGSTDFYLSADVSGAANQVLTLIYEEIRQLPVFAQVRR